MNRYTRDFNPRDSNYKGVIRYIMNDVITFKNSMILRGATQSDSSRRQVAAAIEMSIDRIFFALYYKRAPHKSVTHVHRLMLKMGSMISRLVGKTELNSAEKSILSGLDNIRSIILNDFDMNGISIDQTLLNDYMSVYDPTNRIRRSFWFILSLTNRISYSDTSLVVPYLRITSDNDYVKDLVPIELCFNKAKEVKPPASLWYNIFNGLRFNISLLENKENFDKLCATINIGVLPDVCSGIGITRFYYEAYNASLATQRFVNETSAYIEDFDLIDMSVKSNNADVSQHTILIKPYASLEADFTDSVDPGEEAPEKTDKAETPDPAEPADETSSETIEDPDASEADAPDKSETDETSDPTSTEEDPAIPSDDGSNNEEETKPPLLGINLALANNETLDSFLYKVTVAKFIDNVIQFNHDELPLETVATLTQWKSALLFLTDAEETKKLLAELKIKMK